MPRLKKNSAELAAVLVPFLLIFLALFLVSWLAGQHEGVSSKKNLAASKYQYGISDPIDFGEVIVPENALFTLKARFKHSGAGEHPNLFQTSPGNTGIRVEVDNNSATLIVPDSSVAGGLKGLVVASSLKANKWYELEVRALERGYIKVAIDGKVTAVYESSGIHFGISRLIVGEGFNSDRKYQGAIEDIYISLETKALNTGTKSMVWVLYVMLVASAFGLLIKGIRKFELSDKLIGFWLVMLPVGLYNTFLVLNYFPITEGWFSAYAHLMRLGNIPYRDFYLFIPPLYPLAIASFQSLFGDSFIALRILGLLISMLTAACLYLVLVRVFSILSASLITVMSVLFIESGVAYIGYDFIYIFTLFVLVALNLMLSYLDNINDAGVEIRSRLLLFFSGIFLSISFLLKQSNGVLVGIFAFLAFLFILRLKKPKYPAQHFIIFSLGVAAPAVGIGLWLFYNEALMPFFSQVLFGAIAAKGSISKILFGWIEHRIDTLNLKMGILGLMILGLLILINWLFHRFYRLKSLCSDEKLNSLIAQTFFWLLSLCFAIIYFGYGSEKLMPHINKISSLYAEYVSIFMICTLFGCIYYMANISIALFKSPTNSATVILIISFFGMGCLFGNGTSADIGEVGAFLILAIVFGCITNLSQIGSKLVPIFGFLCLSFSIIVCAKKFDKPYYWWELSSPSIWNASSNSKFELLKGINFPPLTAETIDNVSLAIREHSKPSDEVIAFPNIPLFYLLSQRWPNSKVIVPWFDFLPDQLAIDEASRISKSKPKVIVLLRLSEEVWKAHELNFRGGRSIGHREIMREIENLLGTHSYSLAYESPVNGGPTIEVWYRLK